MSPKDAANAVLANVAEPWVLEIAKDLYNTGKAAWVWDPEVPYVVGLVRVGSNDAWIVVYLTEQDFEVSNDFDALVNARVPGWMQ